MRWIVIAAVALVGCGGPGPSGEGHGGTGGVGGTGAHTDELCATYTPNPEFESGVTVTDCVPRNWPGDGFCWRTTDEPSCLREDSQAVGCVYIREATTGSPAGTQTVGCHLAGDCISLGIDNPECCGGPRNSENPGIGAWDCPTS